jgi:hypothetical protein
MSDWLSSPLQIALSAIMPVAMALLLFAVESRGPMAPAIQASKGLVAPYFTSVAIVFGLFAALLANDAWQKDNAARYIVQAEADSVHLIAQLARAGGIETVVLPKLKAYVDAASAEDPYSASIGASRGKTGKAYQELLASLTQTSGVDATTRTAMLGGARDLLRAHDDRLYLANDITAPIKWLSILVFGGITQIALLLVHVGNRRALRIAVSLFTVAFSFCLVVVAIFDSPFETILSDEPGATLGLVLKSL